MNDEARAAGELPVLTIFSAPKAFRGHVGIIQENAIRSWSRLAPAPRIILFSQQPVTTELIDASRIQVVSDVATNSYGTPLVSDMFRRANLLAEGDVTAFVSADIILDQTVVKAAAIASSWSKHFLVVAQRRDVDIRRLIDFDDEVELAAATATKGKLHSPGAIDLFLYRRGQFDDMPPFAIGRTAYDNWLLWKTVASGMPLIDATDFVRLLHQDHDYSHAPAVDVWDGPEARDNRKWIRHWTNYYSIVHANWKLDGGGKIVKAAGWKYRMAGPRQVLSHIFRATRPVRTRVRTWRFARRYGS